MRFRRSRHFFNHFFLLILPFPTKGSWPTYHHDRRGEGWIGKIMYRNRTIITSSCKPKQLTQISNEESTDQNRFIFRRYCRTYPTNKSELLKPSGRNHVTVLRRCYCYLYSVRTWTHQSHFRDGPTRTSQPM